MRKPEKLRGACRAHLPSAGRSRTARDQRSAAGWSRSRRERSRRETDRCTRTERTGARTPSPLRAKSPARGEIEDRGIRRSPSPPCGGERLRRRLEGAARKLFGALAYERRDRVLTGWSRVRFGSSVACRGSKRRRTSAWPMLPIQSPGRCGGARSDPRVKREVSRIDLEWHLNALQPLLQRARGVSTVRQFLLCPTIDHVRREVVRFDLAQSRRRRVGRRCKVRLCVEVLPRHRHLGSDLARG